MAHAKPRRLQGKLLNPRYMNHGPRRPPTPKRPKPCPCVTWIWSSSLKLYIHRAGSSRRSGRTIFEGTSKNRS